jgi:uncharacterized protein (TIGR00730 family)
MKSLCVFCGSRTGRRPEYRTTAEHLGRLLAERGTALVYGGGNIGLMGAVADACLDAGGHVVGVIPEALVGREIDGRSVEHIGVSRLEVVDSMHTRKARMAELADGFIALPGGFGTFEELFEILTWAQLGFHAKPVGLLNVAGYYDPLLALCDQAVTEGFLSASTRALLICAAEPEQLLEALAAFRPEPAKIWIREEQQL